jgi:hypothetical protein
MLFLLLACHWNQGDDDSQRDPDDTGTPHTGETGETGLETGETGTETGETGNETGETGTDDTGTPKGPVLTLSLDGEVSTVVHAIWTEAKDDSSLEYRFEGTEWLPAPAIEPGKGVVLGIPSETSVEVRVVEPIGGSPVYSAVKSITTGSLPFGMMLPDVMLYDPTIAYDAEYAMISFAGGAGGYGGPWWIQILDRDGRVVWYKEVPDGLFSFSPSIALDGTHIWFDANNIFGTATGDPFVQRQTLDGRWVVKLEVDAMGQAMTEGPDYSWFHEYRTGWGHDATIALVHLAPDGTRDLLWDCSAEHGAETCFMNTCNWSEEHGTLLASMFFSDTVFEVDVATGEVIRQMGQLTSGDPYSFDPPESMFAYQHFPYWLESGNLLVSTHIVDVYGTQVAAEYSVDDTTKTLTRVWSYVSTDVWAEQVGEAVRLPNGNTIQGYGQNGGVREVTTDGEIAWQVFWVSPPSQRTVGHISMIQDLYALNVGGTPK